MWRHSGNAQTAFEPWFTVSYIEEAVGKSTYPQTMNIHIMFLLYIL